MLKKLTVQKAGPFIAVFSMALALTFAIFNDKNTTYLLNGDFRAYFTGATIIKEESASKLYDLEIQRQYQEKITGVKLEGGLLSYRNPPTVAHLLVPLTKFKILTAQRIYILINLAILGLAIFLLNRNTMANPLIAILTPWYVFALVTLLNGQISIFIFFEI